MIEAIAKLIDELLEPTGPSAIVLREELEPVGGRDAIFFPPTFAGVKGYLIDEINQPGFKNSVIVDTVESQANRIEQIFKKDEYAELVPQITLKIGDTIAINLLDVGHRIADALARFSTGGDEINKALEAMSKGDAGPLAKISPTSLIFGFWDSRGIGVKWPRILRSEVRAYNIKEFRRCGQYLAPLMREFKPEKEWRIYTDQDKSLMDFFVKEMKENEKKFQEFLSEMGLGSVPFPKEGEVLYGGCILLNDGKIYRDASLHLVALRSLMTRGQDEKIDTEKSKLLQKYILALSLLALTYPQEYNLREGCLLTRKSVRLHYIYKNGEEKPLDLNHENLKEFTKNIAKIFKDKFDVKEWKREWKVTFERAVEEWKKRQQKKPKQREE